MNTIIIYTGTRLKMRQINKLWKMFLKGFSITFLTALFVSMGVYFILFILGLLPISRNMLVFLTVLIYALAFMVAKAGMKLKVNFYPLSGRKDNGDHSDMKQVAGIRRPYFLKVFTGIWLVTGICSVLWLTPAFIIFWYSLHYPHEVTMLSSVVFSVSAAILYYFIRDDVLSTIKDCFIFFTGSFTGVIIAVFITYYLMSNRIFVTWE